nr:hypothetical protein [Tanacetum cinerariifolium]
MMTLKFADTHNMVAFLSKPSKSDGFEQIVDFLNAHPIRYALTVNPTIYISCIEQFWSTAMAKTINGEVQLHARVDGKEIVITGSSVRRDLQLADEEGIDYLPNSTFFEQLAFMGTTAWNKFSSTVASTIICLGKGFSGIVTPLFQIMVIQNQSELGKGSAMPTDPHHTPTILQPSSSQPQKTQKPIKPKRKDTQVPHPSGPTNNVADEAVYKELGDSLVRVSTTTSSLETKQDSGNLTKTQSKATPNELSSQGTDSGGGPKCQKIIGGTISQPRFERVSKHSNDSLLGRRIDVNDEITLVNDADNEMFDVDDLGGDEDKSKGIMIEEPVKLEKKDQISLDEEAALKLQAEFDKKERLARERERELKRKRSQYCLKDLKLKEFEKIQEMFDRAFKRVKTFEDIRIELVKGKENRAGEELIQESTKKQKKIHKEGKKRLVQVGKARYGSTRPVESMDYLLWSDMKTMFKPHVEDKVWKRQQGYKVLEWKQYDSWRVHSLMMQSTQIYMLVEKKYPLTPPTLSMMLEKKLQIDYESEMAYQLCKLIKKQLKK